MTGGLCECFALFRTGDGCRDFDFEITAPLVDGYLKVIILPQNWEMGVESYQIVLIAETNLSSIKS